MVIVVYMVTMEMLVMVILVMLVMLVMVIHLMTVSCNHFTSLSSSKEQEVFRLSSISPSSW